MIQTFKPKKYRKCPIYFRKVGIDMWEYFVIIKNELYTAHYILKPRWWKRYFKEPFSNKEKQACLFLVEKAAETTVDTILKNGKN